MWNTKIVSGSETISVSATTSELEHISCILLHGAGASDKNRVRGIAEYLTERGIHSIALDFSGHGESSSHTAGSISKRIREAQDLISLLPSTTRLHICAWSMSGQVALHLAHLYGDRISSLILCAPALYARDALDIPFGEEFRSRIRRPESWREHDLEKTLHTYTGKITIIMGDQDTVIPREIPEIITTHAIHASSCSTYIIAGAPHMLAGWSMEFLENRDHLGELILQGISRDL